MNDTFIVMSDDMAGAVKAFEETLYFIKRKKYAKKSFIVNRDTREVYVRLTGTTFIFIPRAEFMNMRGIRESTFVNDDVYLKAIRGM